jgi:hypothetical protein
MGHARRQLPQGGQLFRVDQVAVDLADLLPGDLQLANFLAKAELPVKELYLELSEKLELCEVL